LSTRSSGPPSTNGSPTAQASSDALPRLPPWHTIRRTLFVVPAVDVRVFEAGAAREVVGRERRRLEGWLGAEIEPRAVQPWLEEMTARVLDALEGPSSARGAHRGGPDVVGQGPAKPPVVHRAVGPDGQVDVGSRAGRAGDVAPEQQGDQDTVVTQCAPDASRSTGRSTR
jgi:hypothetical protein